MDATLDLQLLRRRFSEGDSLPWQIPAELEQSWSRSRDAGLMPHSRRLEYTPPSLYQREKTRETNQWLIRHLAPEMQLLWQSLADPQRVLLCIDNSGTIVHSLSAGQAAERVLQALPVGRQILETELGTTAPSCVLHNAHPCMLSGSQHYLSELDRFFCAAVPIRQPNGQLLAVLDVTTIDSPPPDWLQERLSMAAVSIENSLFQELPSCYLLHVHYDARLLDTPLQGVLAISPDGAIVDANPVARKLLGLPMGETFAPGQPFAALLAKSNARHLEQLQRFPGTTLSIVLASGHCLYAKLQRTVQGVKKHHSPSVTSKISSTRPKQDDTQLGTDFDLAHKAFQGGVAILLQGETGVGKEVFSRALHDSIDSRLPFIAIDCSAIPAELIESELFGYREGAFTGGRKGGAIGKIELANGGTLFLDEIGDMPVSLQTRLLRVLQERSLTRLGDEHSIALDFRLISASLKDLESQISAGDFREDLYYRINGLRVVLPPLRERQDIRPLINALLQQQSPSAVKKLSQQALQALLSYHWPGNIRQLQQALKVAVILSGDHPTIELSDFPPDLLKRLQPTAPPNNTGLLCTVERETIVQELKKNQGNMTATAKSLGISRSTLYKKLQ